MNKEELIGKMQMVYIGDKNAFNELIGYYDGLKQGIEQLQQENKELKERIDKAIEYLNQREEDNMCCSVCSVMSDKLLEILKRK